MVIQSAAPSPSTVARLTVAMTAEWVARAPGVWGDHESFRSSGRIRGWAMQHFSQDCPPVGESVTEAGLMVLFWALRMANDPDDPLPSSEELLRRVPVERVFAPFVRWAHLRDLEEIEVVRQQAEEKLWENWLAFKDVETARAQLRALRWLVGVNRYWDDVPAHVARHELPPPEVPTPSLHSRLALVWAGLHTRFGEPLPEPASEGDVDEAERELGVRFPPDLRTSLLLHGQGFAPLALLSLRAALAHWRDMDLWVPEATEARERAAATIPGPVPYARGHRGAEALALAGSWRRSWFPITSAESNSDFYAINLALAPSPVGSVGEVFYWSHELPGRERVVSPSFAEWLEWAETAEEFGGPDD